MTPEWHSYSSKKQGEMKVGKEFKFQVWLCIFPTPNLRSSNNSSQKEPELP